ncbi:MAG: recombination mediator RecR [bacterium]|nr:recombination mediator RecR [bacterium]
MIYPKAIATLIEQFQKFPSVGPKSAQRMAFQILKMPLSEVEKFTNSIIEAKKETRTCEICFNISTQSPCEICESNNRNRSIICVVAETKDLIAIEKTNEYKGLYHVLQGLISPMDGIGAEDIRIKELLNRLTNEEVKEVILAISPSVEGEATSLYLTKLIKPFGIKISRIAFGLPVGADLEYADEVTLAKAIEGRHEL